MMLIQNAVDGGLTTERERAAVWGWVAENGGCDLEGPVGGRGKPRQGASSQGETALRESVSVQAGFWGTGQPGTAVGCTWEAVLFF